MRNRVLSLLLLHAAIVSPAAAQSQLPPLKDQVEEQIAEIRALDNEIQHLSRRLGRQGTPLPQDPPPPAETPQATQDATAATTAAPAPESAAVPSNGSPEAAPPSPPAAPSAPVAPETTVPPPPPPSSTVAAPSGVVPPPAAIDAPPAPPAAETTTPAAPSGEPRVAPAIPVDPANLTAGTPELESLPPPSVVPVAPLPGITEPPPPVARPVEEILSPDTAGTATPSGTRSGAGDPPMLDPIPPPPAPPVDSTPEKEPAAPAKTADTTPGHHTVQSGDTFAALSRQYGVPVEALIKANPSANPKNLKIGQSLVIPDAPARKSPAPAPAATAATTSPEPLAERPSSTPAKPASGRTYSIQSGDTLHAIARKHGITVDALQRANNITNPSGLQIGQTLTIPSGGKPTAPTSAPAQAAPAKSSGSTAPASATPQRPKTPGAYIVKPGDTLHSISRQTGTPIEELRKANKIVNDTIHPGQSLKVRRNAQPKPSTSGESSR